MSRESSIPPSAYGSASAHPGADLDTSTLPPSYQTLLQKQQEHAGLQALKEASGDMVRRVEKLAEMSSVMADGGEALGAVMRNWPHVFSVLGLFEKQPEQPVSPGGTPQQEEEEPLPTLVRLHYTEETAKQQ